MSALVSPRLAATPWVGWSNYVNQTVAGAEVDTPLLMVYVKLSAPK